MQTPINFPFVRDATFISGVGPSISALFLNKNQDGLADLYGALLGRSASLDRDEYEGLTFPAGKLGTLDVLINSNNGATMRVGPYTVAAQGDHGVVEVLTNVAGNFQFRAESNRMHLLTFDWVYSTRVMITDKANLQVVGNRGFEVGLFDQVEGTATSCRFLAGSDQANWRALIGGTDIDTGIAAADDAWFDLQMARLSGNVTAYINGALVGTAAHNVSMPNCRRRIGVLGVAAAAGEGFRADYFRAWFQR